MAKVYTNLKVDASADFSQGWRFKEKNPSTGNLDPVDLTGYTPDCFVKEHPGQGSYTLVNSLPVTWDADTGEIVLEIPADTSAAWVWTKGYYYLFYRHPTEPDIRFAEGWLEVNP
jgi:hypothetical protein